MFAKDFATSRKAQKCSKETISRSRMARGKNETETAYIDGGCKDTKAGKRPGCGVFEKGGGQRNCVFALPGTEQTAQRAEVRALVQALQKAQHKLRVVSDSRYIVDTTKGLLTGQDIGKEARHKDLWKPLRTTST